MGNQDTKSRFAICKIMVGVAALLLAANMAMATTGTATAIPFQNGNGTLSGSFTLNASGTSFSGWDITSTSSDGSHYMTSNNGVDLNGFQFTGITNNGQSLTFIDEFTNGFSNFDGTGPSYDSGSLTLNIDCAGVANCLSQATDGTSFKILSGIEDYAFQQCDFNLCPAVDAPVTLNVLGGAFINVSDPPLTSLNFVLSSTQQGTLFTGTGGTDGTGGTGTVPEPSSLLLMVSGFGMLGGVVRRKLGR